MLNQQRKESKKASKVKSLAPIVPGGCMLKEEKEKSETKSSLSPFTTTESKITNIIAGDGLTFVADIGINLGSIDVEFPNSGHSSVTLANMISFYSIFAEFNSEMTVGEVTEFYENYHVDNVVSTSVEKLLNLFQVTSTGNVADDIVRIKQQINNSTNLNIDFLTETTVPTIATQAKTDTATLYALTHLNPFTIQGDLQAYKTLKADDYSQTYLDKRSEMLYYVIKPKSETSGDEIVYEDKATTIKVRNRPYESSSDTSLVYFADDEGRERNGTQNILTCKDFQSIKSLHVRNKIQQKGARHGAQPKVA